MKALILAGGRGKRLNELTENNNKSMIDLFGKPLIEHNLNHAAELKVKEIIIVVGYRREEIIKYVGKEYKGIKVTYVIQKELRGLVNAIETAKQAIGKSDFILMLADEILIQARLKEMLKKFEEENLFGICGVLFENDKASIGKTYNLMINEKGRIFRLIEKPRFPINNMKGTGHCIFKNEILEYIERTPINANRGEKELVDMIQAAVDEGKNVYAYSITKGYVNVNTKEDLDLAKGMIKKINPKILIVHPQMKFFGGAELLIVELCNWLTKKGFKNAILAASKSKEVEKSLIDTQIIVPRNKLEITPTGFKNIKDILAFIKIFRKELKKYSEYYDVINFHNFPATWTMWPKDKPSVWMLNEPPNLWSKPNAGILLKSLNKIRSALDKRIIQNMDIICVGDEFNRQRCKKIYGKDSRVIYYGVNYDFFSNGDAIKAVSKWKLKDRFVVIQSGMLTKNKNQIESIKAIEKIKNDIPNILLVLAGKEDERYGGLLKRYVEDKHLEKYVLFTGNLNREDLRDLYKASNVGLFPVGKQGGWLAPFEMLCSENPIIVSDDIGAASVIKKNNLGIATQKYAESLIEVYKNSNKYKQKAKEAALFIKKNLSWEIFSEKMIRAYNEAWKMHKS